MCGALLIMCRKRRRKRETESAKHALEGRVGGRGEQEKEKALMLLLMSWGLPFGTNERGEKKMTVSDTSKEEGTSLLLFFWDVTQTSEREIVE